MSYVTRGEAAVRRNSKANGGSMHSQTEKAVKEMIERLASEAGTDMPEEVRRGIELMFDSITDIARSAASEELESRKEMERRLELTEEERLLEDIASGDEVGRLVSDLMELQQRNSRRSRRDMMAKVATGASVGLALYGIYREYQESRTLKGRIKRKIRSWIF